MTISKFSLALDNSLAMFWPANSSAGLGGTGPAAMKHKARNLRFLQNIWRDGAAYEIICQALLGFALKQPVCRWIAQIGINQQHLHPKLREIDRKRNRSRRFAFARVWAGYDQRFWQTVRRRKLQSRTQATDKLRKSPTPANCADFQKCPLWLSE